MNLFSSEMSVGATQNYTTSATCKSFELSNMSHYDIQVQSATLLPYTLPAFATKSFLANPSEEFNFTLQNDPLNPAIQSGEYIQLSESSIAITSSVTPLALIPVYTTDVNISGGNVNISNATLTVTGGVDVNNNPQVTVSNTSIPVTNESGGSLTVAGTLDANITGSNVTIDTSTTNAFIPSSPLVKLPSSSVTISNLSASSSQSFGLNNPSSYASVYDEIWLYINSSGGYIFDYSIELTYTALYEYGLYTQTVNQTFTNAEGNNNIAFTNSIKFADPPVFDSIIISITNTGTNTIASDTVTITPFVKYASVDAIVNNTNSNPVQTQASYLSTTTQLFNQALTSETIAANSIGTYYYTNSINVSNVKRAIFAVSSDGVNYDNGSPDAGFQMAAQGSIDNVNWYWIDGNNSYSSYSYINISGQVNDVFDTSIMPQIREGYTYIRFVIMQYNNTTASRTMSNSNVTLTGVTQE